MRKSVIAVNPASLLLSFQGKNISYKRHKDFLIFFSPCNITESFHISRFISNPYKSPLVLLSQGEGHIYLLFCAAAELSDIRRDCGSSALGALSRAGAAGSGLFFQQTPLSRAGATESGLFFQKIPLSRAGSLGSWAFLPADPFIPGWSRRGWSCSPCREWGWQPEGNSASGMRDMDAQEPVLATA